MSSLLVAEVGGNRGGKRRAKYRPSCAKVFFCIFCFFCFVFCICISVLERGNRGELVGQTIWQVAPKLVICWQNWTQADTPCITMTAKSDIGHKWQSLVIWWGIRFRSAPIPDVSVASRGRIGLKPILHAFQYQWSQVAKLGHL